MVFDYMDHDMTGLMERKGYKFKPEQARRPRCAGCVDARLGSFLIARALRQPLTQSSMRPRSKIQRSGCQSIQDLNLNKSGEENTL